MSASGDRGWRASSLLLVPRTHVDSPWPSGPRGESAFCPGRLTGVWLGEDSTARERGQQQRGRRRRDHAAVFSFLPAFSTFCRQSKFSLAPVNIGAMRASRIARKILPRGSSYQSLGCAEPYQRSQECASPAIDEYLLSPLVLASTAVAGKKRRGCERYSLDRCHRMRPVFTPACSDSMKQIAPSPASADDSTCARFAWRSYSADIGSRECWTRGSNLMPLSPQCHLHCPVTAAMQERGVEQSLQTPLASE